MACKYRTALFVMVWALTAAPMLAQTDEIQVYDAEIAEPGIFNLMIHTELHSDWPNNTGVPQCHHRQRICQRGCRMGLWRYTLVRAGVVSSGVYPLLNQPRGNDQRFQDS